MGWGVLCSGGDAVPGGSRNFRHLRTNRRILIGCGEQLRDNQSLLLETGLQKKDVLGHGSGHAYMTATPGQCSATLVL